MRLPAALALAALLGGGLPAAQPQEFFRRYRYGGLRSPERSPERRTLRPDHLEQFDGGDADADAVVAIELTDELASVSLVDVPHLERARGILRRARRD